MGVGVDLARQATRRPRLREFERSSETVGEFCDRAGASVSAFYRWQLKLTRRSRKDPSTADAPTNPTQADSSRTDSPRARASSAASPALSFLPIAITAATTQIEVLFADGTRVSVPCHDREVIRVVFSSLLFEEAKIKVPDTFIYSDTFLYSQAERALVGLQVLEFVLEDAARRGERPQREPATTGVVLRFACGGRTENRVEFATCVGPADYLAAMGVLLLEVVPIVWYEERHRRRCATCRNTCRRVPVYGAEGVWQFVKKTSEWRREFGFFIDRLGLEKRRRFVNTIPLISWEFV